MKKPQLDFSKLNIPGKIQKAREIVIKLTGNANFPNPNPTLPVLTAAINALELAYEAADDGGKTLKSVMKAKEKILVDYIIMLEGYITSASGGDEQKIQSAGFGVRKTTSHGKRKASIKATKNPGEVILTAEIENGKSIAAFDWQKRKDNPLVSSDSQNEAEEEWEDIDITSAATIKVSDLMVGENYWFRYRLILRKNMKEPWIVLGRFLVPKF
ncbi:MAG: hypothetical protein HXX09_10240 [Bacteroidetes bacterium]|nr:hypothetical protein [Bacteroidota bacterium]